jgi:hypothetical protein
MSLRQEKPFYNTKQTSMLLCNPFQYSKINSGTKQ